MYVLSKIIVTCVGKSIIKSQFEDCASLDTAPLRFKKGHPYLNIMKSPKTTGIGWIVFGVLLAGLSFYLSMNLYLLALLLIGLGCYYCFSYWMLLEDKLVLQRLFWKSSYSFDTIKDSLKVWQPYITNGYLFYIPYGAKKKIRFSFEIDGTCAFLEAFFQAMGISPPSAYIQYMDRCRARVLPNPSPDELQGLNKLWEEQCRAAQEKQQMQSHMDVPDASRAPDKL